MTLATLAVVLLGKRVKEGASDGNTGADAANKGHGGLEHDARSNDNNDALEGVGNRVGNRREFVKC